MQDAIAVTGSECRLIEWLWPKPALLQSNLLKSWGKERKKTAPGSSSSVVGRREGQVLSISFTRWWVERPQNWVEYHETEASSLSWIVKQSQSKLAAWSQRFVACPYRSNAVHRIRQTWVRWNLASGRTARPARQQQELSAHLIEPQWNAIHQQWAWIRRRSCNNPVPSLVNCNSEETQVSTQHWLE